METLKSWKICFNDEFCLTNAATGVELPLNFGRGGQEAMFRQQNTANPAPSAPSVNAITVEPQYATLGTENSVMLTTLYDDGTARHEIIDVEVDEKRKRDEHGQQGRDSHPLAKADTLRRTHTPSFSTGASTSCRP